MEQGEPALECPPGMFLFSFDKELHSWLLPSWVLRGTAMALRPPRRCCRLWAQVVALTEDMAGGARKPHCGPGAPDLSSLLRWGPLTCWLASPALVSP